MQTLKEDLQGDLDAVQRKWLRISVTLILTIISLPIIMIYWLIVGPLKYAKRLLVQFTLPCLRGDSVVYTV